MNTFVENIRKIASQFYLTEAEKFEVYTKAVDQVYRAGQELAGSPEEWTPESIAEAYKKIGALSLTEIAQQVHDKSDKTLQNLRSMLAEVEGILLIAENNLSREWPPVLVESKMDVQRSAHIIDDCKKEIMATGLMERKLRDQTWLSYCKKALEYANEQIYSTLRNDKKFQRDCSDQETEARQQIEQLIQTVSRQNKFSRREQDRLQEHGVDILNQIRDMYFSGHFSSTEVLDAFKELSKIETTVVDVKNTNISADHVQQIIDERLLSRVFKK